MQNPGPIILRPHGATWELLVTVKYGVNEPKGNGEVTYVGLDIGETALVTGCALTHGSPTALFVCDGGRAKQLRKELFTTLKRLQERDAAAWRIDERFAYFQSALTDIVEKASRRAVEYAAQYENPVIMMEDLSYIRERLDYSRYMNRRLHSWAFARLQGRIEEKAAEAGIAVTYVNPAYTSQVCHACRYVGQRNSQAVFRCLNAACHISTFQADINAAANIARQANPWGESVPLDQAGRDDSPQDGRSCDTATTPRAQSRNADDAHGR
jgi:IS605 OrfB family transposase